MRRRRLMAARLMALLVSVKKAKQGDDTKAMSVAALILDRQRHYDGAAGRVTAAGPTPNLGAPATGLPCMAIILAILLIFTRYSGGFGFAPRGRTISYAPAPGSGGAVTR